MSVRIRAFEVDDGDATIRAAVSEPESESESVGVGSFVRIRSRSWIR